MSQFLVVSRVSTVSDAFLTEAPLVLLSDDSTSDWYFVEKPLGMFKGKGDTLDNKTEKSSLFFCHSKHHNGGEWNSLLRYNTYSFNKTFTGEYHKRMNI